MDFERFGIDSRLVDSSEGLRARAIFHEKVLTHALELGENLCLRLVMGAGREEVILLPYLQTFAISSDPQPPRALVLVPDGDSADRIEESGLRLGRALGVSVSRVSMADEAPAMLGDPAAALVIGEPAALIAAETQGLLRLRDYAWVIADGLELIAEIPADELRKLQGMLLPSWERRSLLACQRLTVKAKNLAWDLADNPCEIRVEEDAVKAQSVARETWHVPVEAKLRFLLNLIRQERPQRLCVFCNLKSTTEEVSRRLQANGVRADYILGALSPERKSALLERTRSGGLTALVLTDDGARGMDPGAFPLVVNYDIPLEPEFFVRRLDMIDRDTTAARVVNIACDRYVYGLTAVEQYIDATLNAVQADPSQFNIEDLSDSAKPERESDTRPPARRDDRQQRESRNRPDNRSRAPRPRDDRSPDIRRSIAEATGGTLDVTALEPKRPQESKRPQEAKERKHPSQSREPRRNPPRAEAPRRVDAGNGKATGNPYDLPMEERMKRYREKYGGRLGDAGTDRPRANAGQGRKNQPGRGTGRVDEAARGATHNRQGEGRRRNESPALKEQRREPPPGEAKADPEDSLRKDGLLGRLRGALRHRGT